ncbi:protein of unknown function (plasmid) [Caballeronia sp. S22]
MRWQCGPVLRDRLAALMNALCVAGGASKPTPVEWGRQVGER